MVFGNFLLLKLFVAIMLDGFEVTAAAKIEEMLVENMERADQDSQKKRLRLMDKLNSYSWLIDKKSKQQSTEPNPKKDQRESRNSSVIKGSRFSFVSLISNLMSSTSGQNYEAEYNEIPEPYSLFLFGKNSKFRKNCFLLSKSKYFKFVSITAALLAIARLAFDTTIDWDDASIHLVEKQISYKVLINK
jgi:hypothetical protein